jgi:hypothetical protein
MRSGTPPTRKFPPIKVASESLDARPDHDGDDDGIQHSGNGSPRFSLITSERMVKMSKWLFAMALVCGLAFSTHAQGTPIPFVKPQWFTSNGIPCAGCKLYTYIAGTSTPQATYSDAALTTPNTNPIILDSSGRATVFLGSMSFKFVLTLANGSQLWSVDGVNASALALLSLSNVWTGNNVFQGSTEFAGSVLFDVGFTSLGPSNLTNGGSFAGTFSGSPIFSGVPTFSNGFASTVATGTPPFTVLSTTQVPNLNVSALEGCTWEIPCALGSTTPNSVDGTAVNAHVSLTVNGSTPQTGVQGSDVKLLSSAMTAPAIGQALCLDANLGATNVGCSVPAVAVFGHSDITTVTVTSAGVAVGHVAVTMPAAGCPCRAFISYSLYLDYTGATNSEATAFWVNDGTAVMAGLQTGQSNATNGARTSASYAGYSTATYANAANVTFTLMGESTHDMAVDGAPDIGSGPNSNLQVAIQTSN